MPASKLMLTVVKCTICVQRSFIKLAIITNSQWLLEAVRCNSATYSLSGDSVKFELQFVNMHLCRA